MPLSPPTSAPPPSFSINIGHDPENLALHFNPRFDYGSDVNTIVFNTLSGGSWGDEQHEGHFPFTRDEEAKVGIRTHSRPVSGAFMIFIQVIKL